VGFLLDDEIRFDVLFLQIGIPFLTVAWLHLVVVVKILESGGRYVDTPVVQSMISFKQLLGKH